jgi:hypothetical protein
MSSMLTIANKALRKLGAKEISSLTANGREADRANSSIRDVVREVLNEHPWSHATQWASLPRLASNPPFGYDYAYQLPEDTVRLIDVRESSSLKAQPVEYEMVSGGVIYADVSPCYARYVLFVESDLAKASPLFINACAWHLAEELAIPLAKANMIGSMHDLYLFDLDRARLADASAKHERAADENMGNPLLAARWYPPEPDCEEDY